MTFDPTEKTKLLLAMTAGQSHSLGNVWRVTAKKNDFYLQDASLTVDLMHVSVHGPQDGHDEKPGFFLRVDRKKAVTAEENGYFLRSSVPRHSGVPDMTLQLVKPARAKPPIGIPDIAAHGI